MKLLEHLTVVELADVHTEWCGRLFAQAGARVILIEPTTGAATRAMAPYLAGHQGDPEFSLHFWHYNTDKESVTVDLTTTAGRMQLDALLSGADVLLDAGDEAAEGLAAKHPQLVRVSVTPFGPDGPWAGYAGSDLVHLALGGQMMICGYDDIANTPPLAPTGEQAYHMAGTWAFIAALARLHARDAWGGGELGISVHEACAAMTENAFPTWDYTGKLSTRRTGRHASPGPTPPWQHRAKDGRYINAQLVNVPPPAWMNLVAWMEESGMAEDLTDPKYFVPETFRDEAGHISEVLSRFIGTKTASEFFHGAQARGLIISEVNYPQDLVDNDHLAARMFWREVDMGDGTTLPFAASTFLCAEAETGPWRRAPLLGEHA
ncbi:MAG: CoA transferase [Dehalococcoidia bacterium]